MVEVTDERPRVRYARALVHVNVLDINDNRPMFVRLPYYTVVSLDANRGEHVRQVRAVRLFSACVTSARIDMNSISQRR